jgi:hypothetical protein
MNKDLQKIEQALDNLLLGRMSRVDRFDGDYIDDFHFILQENYDIRTLGGPANKDLKLLTSQFPKAKEPKDLPEAIKSLKGLNLRKYQSPETSPEVKAAHGYTSVATWGDGSDLKKNDSNQQILNDLQKDYSLLSGGHSEVSPSTFWDREGCTERKEEVFRQICEGPPKKKVLCIGPRWSGEIVFIRDKFNCDAVGLDLFSKDESLVVVGDMHCMPFKDNSFDIVYQKNTFNKAYDIRQCLNECVRVLRGGGALISDECLGYTMGVNEIARTSIHRNSWYTAYLKTHIDEILADIEVTPNCDWIELAGLYAAKIHK